MSLKGRQQGWFSIFYGLPQCKKNFTLQKVSLNVAQSGDFYLKYNNHCCRKSIKK